MIKLINLLGTVIAVSSIVTLAWLIWYAFAGLMRAASAPDVILIVWTIGVVTTAITAGATAVVYIWESYRD